jgi:[acyl-carrier-protein] S-malonyltransferase
MRSSLAYIFPGQGSQHVGMGHSLLASAAAAAAFAEVDAALGERLSASLFHGPPGALARTAATQPALLAHSVAALRALQEAAAAAPPLPRPALLLGHSVGEYAALVAGGALGLGAAARLLRLRGEAMQRAGDAAGAPTAMAALLFAPPARSLAALRECVAAACAAASQGAGSQVALAALNSPAQALLSGHASAVARAVALLQGGGGASGGGGEGEGTAAAAAAAAPPPAPPLRLRRVVPLDVSAPFHSPLMAPAALELRDAIAALQPPLQPLRVPLLCGWGARAVAAPVDVAEALVRGVTEPVLWGPCAQAALAQGASAFVEFGPGKGVLGALVHQCAPRGAPLAEVHSVGTMEDVARYLGGAR